jgi:hypothetical protein
VPCVISTFQINALSILKDIPVGEVVWVDPVRMSGIPCFAGTRVPVQALVDHIEGGSTLDNFNNMIESYLSLFDLMRETIPKLQPGEITVIP